MSPEAKMRSRTNVRAASIALLFALAAGGWILLCACVPALRQWQDSVLVTVATLTLFAVVHRTLSAQYVAESHTHQSEARYSALFEVFPQPMWVYDLDSLGFLAVNDAAAAHYGYSKAELLAMRTADIEPAEDVKAAPAELTAATQSIDHVRARRHRKMDGTLFDVEVTSQAVQFVGRRSELVLAQDVTAQRQMHSRLAQSERRLRLADLYAALSATNQAIVRETERDRLFESICRISVEYGAMKAAWIGMASPDGARIVPVASHGTGLEQLNELAIGATPDIPTACAPASIAFHTGQRFLSNDLATELEIGPWREATSIRGVGAATAFPLRSDGRVVGSFTTYAAEPGFFDDEVLALLERMADDISFALDHVAREANRSASADALRVSEERFRELLHSLDDVVWSATLDAQILYLNDAASEVYGRPRQELMNNPALWLAAVHPDDAPGVRAASERLLATGRAEGQYRIVRPDGEVRWLNDRATVIRNDTGEPIRFAGIATDITERKQTEQALREAHRLTQEILRSVQEGIIVCNLDGRFAAWNPYMEKITGVAAEQVLGRQTLEPPLHFAEGELSSARQRALAGEIVVLADKAYENLTTGKSGLVSAVFAPLRDAAGRIVGVIVTAEETTERKRSQKQLQLLSKAVEQSPASIIIADLSGTIEYVNPKFCAVTGYSPDEVIGRNPRMLKSGDKTPEEYAEMWSTISAGKTWHGVFHNRKKNAELFWEEASISPILDADGQITHFVAAMENITERLQAEGALREGRKLLRSIIDTAPMWLACLDRNGRYVVANRRYRETFGKSKAAVEGAHFSEVLPAAQFAAIRPLFEECLKGEAAHFNEESSIGGKPCYSHGVMVPMLDDQDAVTGVVIAITDVTQIRRSEERLLASEARLNEAQHLAHIGSWEIDIASDRIDWSDETYQIFETDRDHFAGNFEAFIALVHPDDRDLIRRSHSESIELGTPIEVIHRLQTQDGRIKFLLERFQTRYDAESKLRSLGSVQDITIVKQTEDQIRALNEQLEKRVQERTAELQNANRELESFSYSVSHDLRAPLRAIDGFSAIIEREYSARLDAEARNMLNRVRAAVQRMGRLIDDLLSLSRLSRSALNRTRTDLSALAGEVVHELRERALNGHVAVSLQEGLVANADPNLMRIVLQNLLDNAWKFSAKQSAPQIEFGATRIEGSDEICYFVRDNGAGFDTRYADKLFGPFQRLHGESEFPGTGIGLATVQRIIHRHGGSVWAEAVVNAGATFYFTLGA